MGFLLYALGAFVVFVVVSYLLVPKTGLSHVKTVDDLLTWTQTLHVMIFGGLLKDWSADFDDLIPKLNYSGVFTVHQKDVDEYNRVLKLRDEESAPALVEGVVPIGLMVTLGPRFCYSTIFAKSNFQHFHFLGLIMKRFVYESYRPLRTGVEFKIEAKTRPLEYVKRGADLVVDIVLSDDEGVLGKVIVRALKPMKHSKMYSKSAGRKTFESSNLVKNHEWSVPASTPLEWLNISGDPNPIHLHPILAKLFGLRSNIMHGTWLFSKAFSYFERQLCEGKFRCDLKFIAPMNLPAVNNSSSQFCVYKTDDPTDFDVVVWNGKKGKKTNGMRRQIYSALESPQF